MALSIGKKIPEGAIKLTPEEAFDHQWKLINNWPNFIDVWPFFLGTPILAGLGAITSIRINSAIRSKLNLRNYGKVISHYTVSLATFTVIGLSHQSIITEKIITLKASCPVCIETQAILLQLGSCVLYPSILSSCTNLYMANKYATYRIPYFADGQGIFKLYLKLVESLKKKIVRHVILNFIAAGFITYLESVALAKIHKKLMKNEIELNEINKIPPETNPKKLSNGKT
ncbi:uncharacterized protein [Chelonus insularis]|uniref:uncharacterized protein n=1 Tax=Chelonus insularis TaxID=460826 RepID=UPI00158F06CC|nr:uncharacterized protein LOC118066129 [Chelonus insularis]